MIVDENVLVTGDAGSAGTILTRRIPKRDPNVVSILDKSEPGLAALKKTLDDDRCRFLSGNISDKDQLGQAVDDVEDSGEVEYLNDERYIFDIIEDMEMPYEWIPELHE